MDMNDKQQQISSEKSVNNFLFFRKYFTKKISIKVNHENESQQMDIDENDQQTTEINSQSADTQILADDTSSTTTKPTTTNIEQRSKQISNNDANERDIKTAAASALAAAAVKAKVC